MAVAVKSGLSSNKTLISRALKGGGGVPIKRGDILLAAAAAEKVVALLLRGVPLARMLLGVDGCNLYRASTAVLIDLRRAPSACNLRRRRNTNKPTHRAVIIQAAAPLLKV